MTVVFKFSVDISGDKLGNLIDLRKNLVGDIGFFESTEADDELESTYGGETKKYTLGYGLCHFEHPRRIAIQYVDEIQEYENWFVSLIEKNYQIFIKYGAENFQISMEIFFDIQFGSCNTEVFSKESLKKLSEFNVALPLSVYALNEQQIADLRNSSMCPVDIV